MNDGGRDRPKLEIELYQSQMVRRIFNGVIDGRGLIAISKELNREEIIGPRSNSWGKTTIHKIFTNETYIGTLFWDRSSNRNLPPARLKNTLPVIVDRDTFQRVQARLREKAFATIHPKQVVIRFHQVRHPRRLS